MFFNETPTCTDTNNLRRADLEVGTNVLVSNSDGSFFTPITVINDENLEGLLCVHASNGSMTQVEKNREVWSVPANGWIKVDNIPAEGVEVAAMNDETLTLTKGEINPASQGCYSLGFAEEANAEACFFDLIKFKI